MPVHLEPFFPIRAFTPAVECGHRGKIRGSDYCPVCDQASRHNERIIDTAPAAPPVEPAVRIARLERLIEEDLLTPEEVKQARAKILAIQILTEPDVEPTRYVPHPTLRGGVG